MRRLPRSSIDTVALAALALLLGAALRLWFIHAYPQVNGDGFVYGDIAKNWLLHGTYGRTVAGTGRIAPTIIRLPGYPLFLAICFRIFGVEHYRAVLLTQTALDLASCLLVAGTVWQACSRRAALFALYLSALCPFTANFVAALLAETLSIFCVALGIFALLRLLLRPGWAPALLLAVAWSYATLLRPDGALLAVSSLLALALFRNRRFRGRPAPGTAKTLRFAAGAGLLSVLPFVPWTVRNWHTFHIFAPLAPRYATDPGEFTAPGFQHWTKTWAVDFASTYEIYWNANSDDLDVHKMPARAFDSPQQYQETSDLFSDYNATTSLSPALDQRFAELAAARTRAHPLRTYIELPLLRVVNMWLRPRTEMLNIELRWWEYDRHSAETIFSAAYAALNAAYLALAMVGAFRWKEARGALLGGMLGFLVLRSLLLADIEAPETRYTIECFPVLCMLAGPALARCRGADAAATS